MPETRGLSLEDIQAAFHHRPVVRGWLYHLRRLFSRSGISPVGGDGAQSDRSSMEMNSMGGANGSTGEDAVDVSSLEVEDGGAGTGLERAVNTTTVAY